jgi:hypothetical protein
MAVVIFAVIYGTFGLVGFFLGKNLKNRPTYGLILGILLGPIGWISIYFSKKNVNGQLVSKSDLRQPVASSDARLNTPLNATKKKPVSVVWKVLGAVLLVIGLGWAVSDGMKSTGASILQLSNPEIEMVKSGHLSSYPNKTVGEGVSGFFGSPAWSSLESDGTSYVNVKGQMTVFEKEVEGALQFKIDTSNSTFELNAIEFNGVPQNKLVQLALMKKIFE